MVPAAQPFATVVTKDYPGEPVSGLDRPGAFRVNVCASAAEFREWAGRAPRDPAEHVTDPTTVDTVIPHPVYDGAGWLAVVDPGPRRKESVRELLRTAHHRARERRERRSGTE